jgi:hypothetical protein
MSNSNTYKNNEINKFIEKSRETLRAIKLRRDKIKALYDNTPLQIKILNIVVPLTLTYIFTVINYNLPLSILFSIITFFMIFIMGKMIAIIYLVFYIIVVSTRTTQINTSLGNPILQTDIINNGTPYNCQNKSLIIANNELAQDLNGGYFTYSFWLYINGNDNNINNGNTWYSYRYNEWKSVFYRGNPITKNNLSTLIQFPGVWLTPVINNLVIVFQNGSYVERLELDNIPFNTWTNYVIVVELKSVSIYINSLLDRTLNLYQSITNMNGNNLFISSDKELSKSKESGFAGYLGELIFYNYALSVNDITNSYLYYKKIIDNYQNNIIYKNSKAVVPVLITNNDYVS